MLNPSIQTILPPANEILSEALETVVEAKKRKKLEQQYARSPFAKLVNARPGITWVPNRNTGAFYLPGLPDGYIIGADNLLFIPIECKAATRDNYAALNLSHWRERQRSYYRTVYQPLNIEYFIVAWVYGDKHPANNRILTKKSHLFVVPPAAWLALEAQLAACGRQHTIALTPALERQVAWRSLTLLPLWEPYRLIPTGATYRVPACNPLAKYLGSAPIQVAPPPPVGEQLSMLYSY